MSRLRRFPNNRFIGRRDEMVVYDCDIAGQFETLAIAVKEFTLDFINQLQSFSPDSEIEARNRGFNLPATDETNVVGD
jgi:hypothetical protein